MICGRESTQDWVCSGPSVHLPACSPPAAAAAPLRRSRRAPRRAPLPPRWPPQPPHPLRPPPRPAAEPAGPQNTAAGSPAGSQAGGCTPWPKHPACCGAGVKGQHRAGSPRADGPALLEGHPLPPPTQPFSSHPCARPHHHSPTHQPEHHDFFHFRIQVTLLAAALYSKGPRHQSQQARAGPQWS